MKEFIGFIKGFGAAIWLVLGALLAIVGYACGIFTAAGYETTKPHKPSCTTESFYSRTKRG